MLERVLKLFRKKPKQSAGIFGVGDPIIVREDDPPLIEGMDVVSKGLQAPDPTTGSGKQGKSRKERLPDDFSKLDKSQNFAIDGKNEFAEIYGSALVGRKQNFLIVIFCLFLAGVSLFYAMRIASDKVAIPWFVEVNKATGELSKPVQIASMTPNQAVIQSQLARFAEKCFTIDPKMSHVYLRECAQMATGKAVEQLRAFRIEHDVIQRIRKGDDYRFAKAKSVDTTQKGVAFIHLATQDLLADGTRSPEKNYRLRLDFKFIPPKDQVSLIENPLGLFVSLFNPVLER
ncbi:VirB8/TrbF family protein [Comamonas testosteroni]|uniref:VirB8/TrbF family protein n=1 Tax=Comamonas testosteroni TaxID=285 RepID=UPI0005B4EA1E|nr:VirB8/TrbF family protein [Comamonas testosteroni]